MMLDDHREFLWWMIIVHGWEPTFYNHYHVMMLLGTDFLELRQAIASENLRTSSGIFKEMLIRLNHLGLAQQNFNGL